MVLTHIATGRQAIPEDGKGKEEEPCPTGRGRLIQNDKEFLGYINKLWCVCPYQLQFHLYFTFGQLVLK